MSEIHQLPNVAGVELEASAWIARLHADDVTTEDLERFEAWRTAHPRHAKAYEAISSTIDEVKRAGRIVRAVSFGNAMNRAGSPSESGSGATRAARRSIRLGVAAAAAIAALAVAGLWWTQRNGSQTLFQTAIGEHASIELPDGSMLELNSNSAARVEYTQRARTIHLSRGEAFFKVAREPQRPFWVMASHSWILAVGTAFNVDLRPSSLRVVVTEGKVKVAPARSGTGNPSDGSLAQTPFSILIAGQQAEVNGGAAKIESVAPMELTRLAAWRKGKLYVENQRLEAVLEELGRYTTSRITIDDESLRQLPIGGTFQANEQGVDALLGMLQEGFGLHVRRERDGQIHIGDAARN